jgi:aspartate racemase
MRTIGLIGGMSWESTAVYYRLINTLVRERLGGLRSAEILMRSIDFERVVALQKAGDWDGAGTLLADVAAGLVRGGADSVLICTNTMHLVAPQVAARPGVRLIHVIDETATAIRAAGCRRPLLLATAYTMEHGFYAERMAGNGVQTLVPDAADRATVHGVIFDELCRGIIRAESRAQFMAVIARGRAAGADSVILGCTEICLLLDPDALGCPGFDSTAIHARAAVDDALRDEAAPALTAAA